MHIEKRSIVTWVIISFLTCGLGFLVWWFMIGSDIRSLRRDDKPNVVLDFILIFLTCGIYGLYVDWKWAKYVNELKRERDLNVNEDLPLICLLLDIFSVAFISNLLMQDELNSISDEDASSTPRSR